MPRPISVSRVGTAIQRPYAVRFKGIHCFGQQRGLDADDMYALISVYPVGRNTAIATTSLKLPLDSPGEKDQTWAMKTGDSRTAADVCYQGAATDIAVSVVLMEQDQADISSTETFIRDKVSAGVEEGLKALYAKVPEAAIIEAIPGFREKAKEIISDGIVLGLKELIGFDNDKIGEDVLAILLPDMIRISTEEERVEAGIEHHLASTLLSDGDASYKVYFDIVAE